MTTDLITLPIEFELMLPSPTCTGGYPWSTYNDRLQLASVSLPNAFFRVVNSCRLHRPLPDRFGTNSRRSVHRPQLEPRNSIVQLMTTEWLSAACEGLCS